jgi:hypothetical protein
MHIIITGYYKKENFGDDLFESYAFNLFNKFKQTYNDKITSIKILPINEICLSQNRTNCDRVILFGGEVLNDYFLDRLIELKKLKSEEKSEEKSEVKFVALGVSCNQDYNQIINKINIFEYVIFRTKKDFNELSKYVPSEYVPDVVFNMTKRIGFIKKNIVGFFLSQTSLQNLNNIQKNKYIAHIVTLIRYLMNKNYKILLFPMCTNTNKSENDNIINQLVYSQLSETEKKNIKAYITSKKILKKINILKFAVCFRYHAHILCIVNQIPFISISNTPKVINLLNDNNITDLYSMPINYIDKFNYITENLNLISNKFKQISNINNKLVKRYNNFDIYIKNKSDNTFYIDKKSFDMIYNYICYKFKQYNTKNDDYFNTQIVTHFLMGTLENEYTFGLNDKIHKGIDNLKNDIYWLINDCIIQKNLTFYNRVSDILNKKFNPDGLININYINQNDYKGLHRSGWQYVVDNLYKFNGTDGLICDLYLDRTFHWNVKEYQKLGLIPYRKQWIGIIHHTCDTHYSIYNTINLFKNKIFLQSLKTCEGLILLSNDLKTKVDKILNHLNLETKTYLLYHPTQFISEDKQFNKKKFIMNTSKKIIQIGAWMRNIDAINNLDLGVNRLYLNKYALKGKKMESYYFDSNNDVNQDTDELLINNETMCRDKTHKSIKLKENIHLINYLENEDYDKLLSENIVFINLYGASAVNTVIECVVRNTPILVNRLSALEEILGKKYPMFYDRMDQIKDILDMKLIDDTYEYLKNLDKSKLKIETFINGFEKIAKDINDKIKVFESLKEIDTEC